MVKETKQEKQDDKDLKRELNDNSGSKGLGGWENTGIGKGGCFGLIAIIIIIVIFLVASAKAEQFSYYTDTEHLKVDIIRATPQGTQLNDPRQGNGTSRDRF